MTLRRRPDDPPRKGDELLPERTEPVSSDPDERIGPAAELPGDDLPTAAEPATVGGTAEGTGAAGAGGRLTTPLTGDELPYVDDRISKLFIGAMVAVFTAIFAYAILFGGAGVLTPDPTPRPSRPPAPSVSPAVSPSGSPDGSPSGSPQASPSESPSAEPSPSASPSESPSVSPPASPGGSPSASPGGSPAAASPSGSPITSPSPAGS